MRHCPSYLRVIAVAVTLSALGHGGDAAGQSRTDQRVAAAPAVNPLDDLRGKRRAFVMAGYVYEVDARSLADARSYARAIVSAASDREAVTRRRHGRAYRTIKGRLEQYGRKYKSLDLVDRPEEADFIVFFHVTGEYHPVIVRSYDNGGTLPFTPRPVGELLVVRQATRADPEPKIVAHTSGGGLARDVTDGFIKELKAARGER